MTTLDDLKAPHFRTLTVETGVKFSLIGGRVPVISAEMLRYGSCAGCVAATNGPMPHINCVDSMPDCTGQIFVLDTPKSVSRYIARRLTSQEE